MMETRTMTLCLARLMPLAILAALAACEPTGEKMHTLTGPMPSAPPPVVVRDEQRHLVVDLPANGAIGAADWARIDQFLRAAAPERPETVRLTVAGDASPAVVDLVIRHAFASGYVENKIAVAPPTGGYRGHGMVLRLTSRTAIAVPPNCPQTAHLDIIDGDNLVASDWGCASVSNLELQVADPHDLVRGQGGGETDSVMTTAAIRRLETDKLKKLDTSSTTQSTSAGGGQ
ncbi:MAG TPA: CpaD family pilus assembly lipoprotein [Stellaceae bacterium]|nr:CpaD family pilus assembly lipoprotein [Stellaceae bacterium]